MDLYNVLSLIGLPAILAAVAGYLIKQIRDNDRKTEAVQLGLQSILMDRLDYLHDVYVKQGWADIHKKRLFENMYNQYKVLGTNGVMEQSWKDVQALPTQPINTERGMT